MPVARRSISWFCTTRLSGRAPYMGHSRGRRAAWLPRSRSRGRCCAASPTQARVRPVEAIVTFTYPGMERPALADVNVDIEPGQLVALVGPSGAGKTTFSALAARLIGPQVGRVALDGHDLRDLTLDSLHRSSGIVFQDPYLFHATLRETLRYGRPDASDAEIWAAVCDANLDDLVRSIPAGSTRSSGNADIDSVAARSSASRSPGFFSRIRGYCSSTRPPRISTTSPND
jgi:ABC-type transport system involved in cytochrome bd biosynthesis fused ATPase/permease subunit